MSNLDIVSVDPNSLGETLFIGDSVSREERKRHWAAAEG